MENKKCLICGILLPIIQFGVDNSKKDRLQIYCKNCKREKTNKYYSKNSLIINKKRKLAYKNNPHKNKTSNSNWYTGQGKNPQWVITPQLWYFNRVKYHANSRKKCVFDLTFRQFTESFSPTCALTGVKLFLTKTRSQSPGNQNASLDRIDSSKGYDVGNIQWVDWRVNHIKGDIKNEEFIKICNLVSHQHPLST